MTTLSSWPNVQILTITVVTVSACATAYWTASDCNWTVWYVFHALCVLQVQRPAFAAEDAKHTILDFHDCRLGKTQNKLL